MISNECCTAEDFLRACMDRSNVLVGLKRSDHGVYISSRKGWVSFDPDLDIEFLVPNDPEALWVGSSCEILDEHRPMTEKEHKEFLGGLKDYFLKIIIK